MTKSISTWIILTAEGILQDLIVALICNYKATLDQPHLWFVHRTLFMYPLRKSNQFTVSSWTILPHATLVSKLSFLPNSPSRILLLLFPFGVTGVTASFFSWTLTSIYAMGHWESISKWSLQTMTLLLVLPTCKAVNH